VIITGALAEEPAASAAAYPKEHNAAFRWMDCDSVDRLSLPKCGRVE
jgi:hypothetical protein